jgi:hypothetical protein
MVNRVLGELIEKNFPELRTVRFLVIETPQCLMEKGAFRAEAHASISLLEQRYREALSYDVELNFEEGLQKNKKLLRRVLYHELAHIRVLGGSFYLMNHNSRYFQKTMRRMPIDFR